VTDWPLPAGKIGYSSDYEDVLVMRWSGESMAGWRALSQGERSYLTAAYRSSTTLDAVLADEHNKEVKRRNRRGPFS
jgi:hypothetical protein